MRFRYEAIAGSKIQRGEIAAENPHAARLLLRRAQLRCTDLRPLAPKTDTTRAWSMLTAGPLRNRRRAQRSEVFFALSTMLETGLSTLDAVGALSRDPRQKRSTRRMLTSIEDMVAEGVHLGASARAQPGWFDALECAVLDASHASGDLPRALQMLGERAERAGAVSARLGSALLYPCVVLIVTMVVVVLLSRVTIPPMIAILTDAGIQPPALTSAVVTLGRALGSVWMALALMLLALATPVVLVASHRTGITAAIDRRLGRWMPAAVRDARIALLSRSLADLVDAGVPMMESIRIAGPCVRGVGAAGFRQALAQASDAIEGGESIERAFGDGPWFPPEFGRMLGVGQESGDLAPPLRRLAQRYEAKGRRSIDRLTSVLEPAAIIMMSVVVGVVVLAAVLPLLKLQELV